MRRGVCVGEGFAAVSLRVPLKGAGESKNTALSGSGAPHHSSEGLLQPRAFFAPPSALPPPLPPSVTDFSLKCLTRGQGARVLAAGVGCCCRCCYC